MLASLPQLPATPLSLRPYQETCVEQVLTAYRARPAGGKALVVLPTAGGKTIVFTEIARRLGLTTLIIAHRQELLQQAADKFHLVDPTAIIGQVGAGRHEWGTPITVASVQTISRPEHLKALQRFGYALVIIDECHHSASAGYQAVLDALPDAFVVGVTATPDRLDKQSIEQIFGEPVFTASIIDMVEQGYLCDLRAIAVQTDITLDHIHTQAGDFRQDELEEAIDTPERNARVVTAYLRYGKGRQTICFAVTVAHASHLARSFLEQGVEAAVVSGEMPAEERRRLLHDFERGMIEVMCNVGILTEGYDHPQISCVIMARPTQSRALYVQCLDTSTEILTPNGWKSHHQVQVGDLVAGYDKDTGAIQWTSALRTVQRSLAPGEKMFELHGPSLDIRVTGGHRMIYRTRYGRKRTRTQWDFLEAQDLSQHHSEYEIPIAGVQITPGVELTDDELRFIGWFLTDGTLNKQVGQITIYQAEHQPHHEAIRSCLEGCGFKYTTSTVIPKSQFHATSPSIRYMISKGKPRGTDTHLTGWGKLEPYIDKNFSPLLETMTSEQLGVMLEAIHLGDGNKQRRQTWTQGSYHIITGNNTFAERLQSLCVRRGFKCNMSSHQREEGYCYVLHIKKTSVRYVGGNHAPDRPHLEVSPSIPGETVWCVENALGTLVTRRNGKVAIVGNCIGRGTRLAPGKQDCVILDITDNCLKHRIEPLALNKALTIAMSDGESILECKKREDKEAAARGAREESERTTRVTHRAQDLTVNLLTRMEWRRLQTGTYLLEIGEEKHRIFLVPSEEDEGYYAVWARLAPGYQAQQWAKASPLSWAMQHAEMKARLLQADAKKLVLVDSRAAWRTWPASAKQRFMLTKLNIPYREGMTSGEASDLIGHAIAERERQKEEKKAAKQRPRQRARGRASA